jgi:hypothetical protein
MSYYDELEGFKEAAFEHAILSGDPTLPLEAIRATGGKRNRIRNSWFAIYRESHPEVQTILQRMRADCMSAEPEIKCQDLWANEPPLEITEPEPEPEPASKPKIVFDLAVAALHELSLHSDYVRERGREVYEVKLSGERTELKDVLDCLAHKKELYARVGADWTAVERVILSDFCGGALRFDDVQSEFFGIAMSALRTAHMYPSYYADGYPNAIDIEADVDDAVMAVETRPWSKSAVKQFLKAHKASKEFEEKWDMSGVAIADLATYNPKVYAAVQKFREKATSAACAEFAL